MFSLSWIIATLTLMGSFIFPGTQVYQNIDVALLADVNSAEELTFVILKAETDSIASGTLVPKGKPVNPPIRVGAGKNCIVDLVQTYSVTGTLSGTFEIDYRILVYGPCGVPPGTYKEEWIAYGTFEGKINETPASGKFSYVAHSKVSGEVEGHMVFDQGINGELEIKGNFKDRKLSYKGWVD
ncbi:MAG: hypothetical protein GY931_05735 [Maribacter sp.]|nr:hypothetical protein [Maribacter sp.]